MATEPVVRRIATTTDPDAEYVHRRIAEADQHKRDALSSTETRKSHQEQERQARIEAGLRLIAVHDRLVADKSMSATSKHDPRFAGWNLWLTTSNFNKGSAHRHMKLAGWTPEKRAMSRKAEAKRKRELRRTMPRPLRKVEPHPDSPFASAEALKAAFFELSGTLYTAQSFLTLAADQLGRPELQEEARTMKQYAEIIVTQLERIIT